MLPSERVRQEETLRAAALAGDESAWRALYDGACAPLWAYVVWRCAGLRDAAEEIMQETWLVAVRRLADFEPVKGPFLAWLRGISANHLHNYFRARRRHPEESLAQQDLPVPDERERREQAELIALALAELPDRYETVLRVKYLEALSVEQIAAEWSETRKAIESVLTRAREAFRIAYERLAGTDIMLKEKGP